MTNAILRGKPDAGNPHVRFDEGEVASAKPRRGSLLYKQLLAVGVAAFAMASAVGADYYYKGGNLPWTEPSSYTVGKEDATELPGASDFIVLSANKTAFVDDDSIAFFSRVNRVFLHGENITFTIDITTNATFGCWLGDQGGSSCTNTWVVKKGAGELFFSKPWTQGAKTYSYTACIDVQEGAYHAAPTVSGATKHQFETLRIAKGATFYGVTNNTTVISTLAGAGVVTNDSPIASRNQNFSLQINSGNNIAEPTEFSGQIFSGVWIVYYASYVNFTGTGGKIGEFQVAGYSGGNQGRLGVTSLASAAESPFGGTGFDCRGSVRTIYLGEPGGKSVASYTMWDTGSAPVTIDAGEKGGWNLTGGLFTVRDATAKQQRIELTGEDTAAPCVLSNTVEALKDGSASVYLTKSGSGTWKIYDNGSTQLSGAIAVKDGTLAFNTLAEQGQRCALGTATRLYEDKCAAPANLQTVPYACLVGTAGDRTKTGTLAYTGTKNLTVKTRPVAVQGRGGIASTAGARLNWANIGGFGGQEGELVLTAAAGETSQVSELADKLGGGTSDGSRLSVAKEGAGTAVLSGNLGFTGDLTVKGGELVVKDLNNAPFSWFRMTVKEIVGSSPLACYQPYRAKNNDNWSGRCSRNVSIEEFALYGANGKLVNKNEATDRETSEPLVLAPGQIAFERADEISVVDSRYLKYIIDDNMTGGQCVYGFWKNDRNKWPRYEEPDTWMSFVQRMPAGAAEAVSFDLLCITHTNDYADDAHSYSRFACVPTAFTIQGSADGFTWEEAFSTNNIVFLPDQAHTWLSDGTVNTTYHPSAGQSHKKIALAQTRYAKTYARPVPRSVAVASGAKLTVEGTPVTASGVTLGTDGFGTVSGVKLAASGTVDLVCDLSGKPEKVVFPADFSQFGDAENVLGYTVTVNGGAVPRAYEASVTPKGAALLRKGLVLIVR